MFEKVWAMSSDLKTTITLWRVTEKRFIRPVMDGQKPPKEVKVVGDRSKLTYIGTDLECDIYTGEVGSVLDEDMNVPDKVLSYVKYQNISRLIITQIREKVNEIVQESRSISEISEDNKEPNNNSSCPEDRSE